MLVCVFVCSVWDSLEQFWVSEVITGGFVVCVCLFVCVCACVSVCAACGRVWSRFGGLSLHQVALVCVSLRAVCVCFCAAFGTVWS